VRRPNLINGMSEEMDYPHQEIVKLNQIGIELHQFQKYLAASFHFNEALRLLSKFSEREVHNACASLSVNATSCKPNINLKLRRSLLQPLAIDPDLPIAHPKDWDRIYALTILHNIALTNYSMNFPKEAERMLRLALRLVKVKRTHRHCNSRSTRPTQASVQEVVCSYNVEDDDQLCAYNEIYSYLDVGICVVLMSIYHMMGTVLSQMNEKSLTEALECYIEAFHAGQQLGGHVLVACVCVSIGRLLVQEGCILEASYAYDMAKCIYCTIPASDNDDGLSSCLSSVGCSGAAAA
jgi:tetratricopeptide (TPR) repeat protein